MVSQAKYSDRKIPKISLRDYDSRIDEITADLIHAAETDGFFALVDHGLSIDEIEAQFAAVESFFRLPDDVKATMPMSFKNAGWEKNAQVRPSTGKADQKESYQMQFGEMMKGLWPSDEVLPGFKEQTLGFMWKVQKLSEKVMVCFARGLGFPDQYFVERHNANRPNIQTVLRALHYFALDPTQPVPEGYYRAGAHVDWDFLTLLFQRPGQSGLEICPGREVFTEHGLGDTWTKVEAVAGEITCNM
jgi:isopenicillin N synthase-like dioxygenase